MAIKIGSNIVQGLMGNMSEVSTDSLVREFGSYLMYGETIQTGFKLIRDALVITDRRILSFDKQGTTGQKMRVTSIYLNSIFQVSAETAGFGLDDSELTITFITSPYMKTPSATVASRKFEFPKHYNIQGLYKMLQQLAYDNYTKLNG